MTPFRRNAVIAAMFLVPVLCCFVGIGAFVHMTLAAEEVQRQKEEESRQGKLDELAELQEQLNALRERAEALRQEISDVNKRIQGLAEHLLELRGIGELSEELNEEIDCLRKVLAKLMVELTALEHEIAQKQEEIEKLQGETENVDSLGKEKEKLREQLDELRERLDEAKATRNRLRKKLAELRRWRDEEENKHELCPAKPLPPGRPKPVFLECNANDVVIQPEGTKLRGKPRAGDRKRFLAMAQKTGYVVFLIRPSGFHSFKHYRQLVHSHNNRSDESIQFGFEPVDVSWSLVYPDQES